MNLLELNRYISIIYMSLYNNIRQKQKAQYYIIKDNKNINKLSEFIVYIIIKH